jgi:hypothetical protein
MTQRRRGKNARKRGHIHLCETPVVPDAEIDDQTNKWDRSARGQRRLGETKENDEAAIARQTAANPTSSASSESATTPIAARQKNINRKKEKNDGRSARK